MSPQRDVAGGEDDQLARTATEVLHVCAASADERIVILADDATASVLLATFTDAVDALGTAADRVTLTVRPRRPAFADIPDHALDTLLAADLVLDLTTVPWLYSDSFTRYARECQESGSRLALIWGTAESVHTIAACPPSPTLIEQARGGLAALNAARTLRVRSRHGTDFAAALGDLAESPRSFIGEPPIRPGMIGAPLCASVTAPFVPGSASGKLAFVGAGRYQGPENLPIRSDQPVALTVDAGRVVNIESGHAAAIALAEWFVHAGHDDGSVIMDCNIGFDPRADLAWADNTVVHSYAGGIMIGIGNPYEFRPEGSRRPGYHLDLMFPGCDVDLDDVPFIRAGKFV